METSPAERRTVQKQAVIYGLGGLAATAAGIKLLNASNGWNTGIPSGLFAGFSSAVLATGVGIVAGAGAIVGIDKYAKRTARKLGLPPSPRAMRPPTTNPAVMKEVAPSALGGLAVLLGAGVLGRLSQQHLSGHWATAGKVASHLALCVGIVFAADGGFALGSTKVMDGV